MGADDHTTSRDDAGATAAPPMDGPRGSEPGGDAPTLPEGADQEAHDRAVFQRLVEQAPDLEPADEPLPGVPSDAYATPTPGSTSDGSQPPSSRSEPGAAPDGADLREATEIARSVLQRDGLPASTIDRIVQGATVDELRTVAESARNRQAGYDRLGNRVRDLERKFDNGGKGKERDDFAGGDRDDPAAASRGASNADDDLADLSPAQARLVQKYRDQGDEDMAEAHIEAFRETNQQAGRASGSAGEPSMAQRAEQLREPFDSLQAGYPQLADDARRVEVLESAERLLAAGVIEQEGRAASDILRDALAKGAAVRFGEFDPHEAQRRLHRQHSLERNGQPTPGTQRGGGSIPEPPSPEVADRAVFRALQHGKSPEEAAELRRSILEGKVRA